MYIEKNYTSPLISSVIFVFRLFLFFHTFTAVLKGMRRSSVSQLFSLSPAQMWKMAWHEYETTTRKKKKTQYPSGTGCFL